MAKRISKKIFVLYSGPTFLEMGLNNVKKGNNGAQTAASVSASPAGIICFVQVSVRESVLPVQYGAYQLSSVLAKITQSY